MDHASAPPPLGRLHVITDEVIQTRFDALELARRALDGGADVIQYRDKRTIDDRVRWATAEAIAIACAEHGATLIVDDRADIAAAILGAGLHVGDRDLPPHAARRVLGPHALLGMTVNDETTLMASACAPVDYLGVGPVYGTTSKADPAPPLGIETLERWIHSAIRPVIAIGSIDEARLGELLATGVHGVAVLSAVCLADDPAAATRALKQRIETEIGA